MLRRSAEWFDALATSRYVVTNCWLPNAFRRRPGQVVLQAWHGTTLKKLGFDRLGRSGDTGYQRKRGTRSPSGRTSYRRTTIRLTCSGGRTGSMVWC